ncbi:MAG: PAS domain S-box protein [Phycisphaerales bacterium]|nr:MAG: PAS domain S-box protein [Phycisphaerales bacterium]
MAECGRTKAQLVAELETLRARLAEYEQEANTGHQSDGALTDAGSLQGQELDELSKLYDCAPVGLLLLDADLRFVRINDWLAATSGIPATDHIGRTIREIVPEIAETLEPIFSRILETGQPVFDVEAHGILPPESATERYWLGSFLPLKSGDGKVVAISGIVLEVTERRRVEERAQLLSSAIEQANEGIAVTDLQGNLVFINHAFASMHGYTPAELLGKNLTIFHTDEQLSVVKDANRQIMETGKFHGEVWHLRRDGSTFPMLVHNTLVRNLTGEAIAMIGTGRDVTDETLAEEALRESQRTLATLMSNLPGMAYRCRNDPDWTMEFVSEGCAELTGYEAIDLIGNRRVSYAQLIHPEDRRPVWDGVQAALEDQQPFRLIYRITTADGRVEWVFEKGRGVFALDGTLLALEGFVTDITERKRAEEALQQAHDDLEQRVEERTADLTATNKRLADEIDRRKRAQDELRESSARVDALAEEQRTLLRHTRDFLYRHDTEGIFRYISAGVEQITGYSVLDWRNHYTTYLTDNPINERGIALTEETLRTGKENPPYLVELRHKQGHAVMLEVSERPYYEEGKIAGIIGVARDVTERVRAEQALRDSEEHLRTVINASKDAIIAINENGTVTLFNPAAEQMFKRQASEVLGGALDCLMPEEYRNRHSGLVRSYFTEGTPNGAIGRTVELPAVRSDGERFSVELSLSVGQREGERFALAVVRDVTDRKLAEQALMAAKEDAEAASRAKTRFLANVSHEIRTPIMATLGAAELISHGGEGAADSEHLDVILRNGQHLLSLVEDLLDLSRADAGKLEIRMQSCFLPDILADIRAVVAPLHHQSEVEFRILCDGAIPDRIHTDPIRLKQAVINLISNALKFTDTGHVYVRVGLDQASSEPRLTVTVEDTGGGIPSADLERIFDIFTQLDRGTSSAVMGMGLGLPLAKWIAGCLGGNLKVSSVQGKGSTFVLEVSTGPLEGATWIKPEEFSIADLTVPAMRESPPSRCLCGRVLVAEDSADLRGLMTEAISAAGAEVHAVADGEAAVATATDTPFDLIILDVRMPKMDGLTAVGMLRQAGCLTPIIALTASTSPGDQERILGGGFDALWTKPISLHRIVQAASEYLHAASDEKSTEGLFHPSRRESPVSDERLASAREDFVRSLPDRLGRLQIAVDAGNLEQAHEILHQLAGTAGTLGHMSLSQEAAWLIPIIKADASPRDRAVLGRLEKLILKISRAGKLG